MKQSPPLKGKRVRGYRIHVFRGTRHQPPSITTSLMWRESVPVAEWQRIISDPSTMQAYIIRSGRKMKAYQYSRQDVSK